MKTINVIIFSLCIGFFIIGVYETLQRGISFAYTWFMISTGLLLWYTYRRRSQQEHSDSKQEKSKRKNADR